MQSPGPEFLAQESPWAVVWQELSSYLEKLQVRLSPGVLGLPAASTVSRGHVACLINKDQTSINLASDLIKIHIQVKKKKDFCLFKFRGLFPITNVLSFSLA